MRYPVGMAGCNFNRDRGAGVIADQRGLGQAYSVHEIDHRGGEISHRIWFRRHVGITKSGSVYGEHMMPLGQDRLQELVRLGGLGRLVQQDDRRARSLGRPVVNLTSWGGNKAASD